MFEHSGMQREASCFLAVGVLVKSTLIIVIQLLSYAHQVHNNYCYAHHHTEIDATGIPSEYAKTHSHQPPSHVSLRGVSSPTSMLSHRIGLSRSRLRLAV